MEETSISIGYHLGLNSSGSKLIFWGATIFAPSDTVDTVGHFQVVTVILVHSKSNLCTFLIAVSFLRGGGMASSGLLFRSTTGVKPNFIFHPCI